MYVDFPGMRLTFPQGREKERLVTLNKPPDEQNDGWLCINRNYTLEIPLKKQKKNQLGDDVTFGGNMGQLQHNASKLPHISLSSLVIIIKNNFVLI